VGFVVVDRRAPDYLESVVTYFFDFHRTRLAFVRLDRIRRPQKEEEDEVKGKSMHEKAPYTL
jgi:hypothetical protein